MTHIATIRPAYSETDQMGFVHHSNYVKYLEYARWEALRKLGLPYKEMEAIGFFMPVVSMELHFFQPAFYDELLKIEVKIILISGARIQFDYKIYNQKGDLINSATTVIAFLRKDRMKPCRIPPILEEKLSKSALN